MGYESAKEHPLPTGAKPRNRRPTIGFLTPGIKDANSQALWSGVTDGAQRQDVNLISFPGGSLLHLNSIAQANLLYHLVTHDSLDGLVSWASAMCVNLSQDDTLNFHRRYGLPLVSLTLPMREVPTVAVDTHQGMREEMLHLVESHGYRRLAFVRGPEHHPYAQERYRAYMEVLEAYDIPFDPALVTPPGNWTPDTGIEAIRLLLEERNLHPQADFEAVVTVTDGVAIGVLDALQARGVRVPEQVAVVGFNDTLAGQAAMPPLTSVAMPFHEQGGKAVEVLLKLIEGKPAPEHTILPARLVLRQSCGCQSRAVMQAAAGTVTAAHESFEAALAARREDILAEILQAMGRYAPSKASEWAKQLLDSFAVEMKGRQGNFLFALGETLREATASGGDVSAWQEALSALRRHVLPSLSGERLSHAEDVWQQARVAVGEMVQQAQARRSLQTERQVQTLREISQSLITTFDIQGLTDVLAEQLPHLDIPSCYLSLYEDPQKPTEWSRLILAYNENGRIELEAEGQRFPSRDLIPEGLWSDRRYSFVIEPLYFQADQIGFVLFEMGPQAGYIYDVLRGEISSALQGALLVQRVQERSGELARQQYVLDTFMSTVPDRIHFKDLEGRFTRANRAHAQQLGLSDPAQEIGKTDFDFFTREEAQLRHDQEQDIIRTGQPLMDIEEQHTSPDGRVDWTLMTKMPLRDENDTIVGTFGISRDITERKQAEQELREREEKYRTILEDIADGYYEVDIAGNLTFFNDSLCRLYGYSKDELMGMNYRQYMDDETAKAVYQTYNTVYRTGKPSEAFDCEITRKDGTRRFAQVSVSLMRGLTGEPVGFRGIARDITERKRAEEELRAARQQLMDIIDFLPDGTFVIDQDKKVIAWNRAAEEMTGVRKEDILGQGDYAYALAYWGERRPVLVDFIWMEDAEFMSKYSFVQKKGNTLYSEVFVPRVYGGRGAVLWATASPLLDSQGNKVGAIESIRDVTERKQLEQQIQESLERLGRQVQTSTEVAQEIATAPALDEIFRRVVTLIKERFNYYHTQVFRHDPALNAVVLVSGYGEAGQKMLAAGHRLAMGRGVVGTAAATGKSILATDVAQDKDWQPNPNLPHTKGELAVPIKLRDQVLGILDVQSDRAGALTAEDQLLLEGLCGQIAAAMESTRLRQEMEVRLNELSALYRATAREGWQAYGETLQVAPSYLFDQGNVRREDVWLPQIEQAIKQNTLLPPSPIPATTGKGQREVGGVAVAPLSVRGQVIGAVCVYDDPQNPLSQDDLALVQEITEQGALALESARLFEQTQARARREQTLREITARVRSSMDPDTVLRTAIRELGTALGRPAFVRLGSAEQLSKAQSVRDDGKDLTQEGGE